MNLAGLPALTLPCGFAEGGPGSLPVGLQMIGAAFDEVQTWTFSNLGVRHFVQLSDVAGVFNGPNKGWAGLNQIWARLDKGPLNLIWALNKPTPALFWLKIILIPIYQFIIIKLKNINNLQAQNEGPAH